MNNDDPVYRQNAASIWQSPAPGRLWRWCLRLGLAAALASSAYLAWSSLSGSTVVGCSALPQIDCRQVLAGRWSRWFSVPVSVPAAFVYATMLVALMGIGRTARPGTARVAWLALVFMAMLTAGAAVWFLGLMVFAQDSFCLWCCAVHANALFSAALIAFAVRRRPTASDALHAKRLEMKQTVATRETYISLPCVSDTKALCGGPTPTRNERHLPLVKIGLLAAAARGVLICGQWLGPLPPTNRVEQLSDEARVELTGGMAGNGSSGLSSAA